MNPAASPRALPTPDTISSKTARCSACCDRRGDQSGDRSRLHAAARGGMERIRPNIFDGGNAEGVDRRPGDDEARKSRPLWRQTQERFRAARQRALVGGSAYVDCVTAPASLQSAYPALPGRVTIRIPPSPRRYLRLSFALSFRSSFHVGGVRSRTTAQSPSRVFLRSRGRDGPLRRGRR
jgi:hypothetical protein